MFATPLGSGLLSERSGSPRWLVTNGDITVGPVHTELLLRGYLGGRIPEHCQVREVHWGGWRPLAKIREIGSLKRRLAREAAPLTLREASVCLPLARDAGNAGGLLSVALQLAAQVLDASAGLVHRYRSPVPYPVTSTVLGVAPERLGEVMPASDPSYLAALRGKSLCGSPHTGLAERLIAERLQFDGPLAGVVMTPVVVSGRLFALLELGRTGHAFRADDADDLAEYAAQVAQRLA